MLLLLFYLLLTEILRLKVGVFVLIVHSGEDPADPSSWSASLVHLACLTHAAFRADACGRLGNLWDVGVLPVKSIIEKA